MMYPSFPNLGPSWPEVCYARFISCFLSSGRVVIMAYSSVFCGKRSTNGMVVPLHLLDRHLIALGHDLVGAFASVLRVNLA